MKKMVYIVAAAVVTSTALTMPVRAEVSTDVLMWYLDLGDSPEEGIRTQTFDTLNFYLRSTEDPSQTIDLTPYTYLNMDDVGTGQGAGTASGIDGSFAGVYHTDLSGAGNIDYTKYEFMMSLYSGGNLVAWSETLFNGEPDPVMKTALAEANALYNRASGGDLNPSELPPGVTPYNFGSNVVPEPTGGLLMLVGGALLSLRRKRKIV